jgi:hypothetical protein
LLAGEGISWCHQTMREVVGTIQGKTLL